MLPFAAISISFTLTTILLFFSIPIEFQKNVSVNSLQFIQKWLLDWRVEPDSSSVNIVSIESVNSIVSNEMSESELELDTNQPISNLDLSFLKSSSVSILSEEMDSHSALSDSRNPSMVQIQLYCILFSVSLLAIYFAALPFYQFVSSCPRQRSGNTSRFGGYQNPLQKCIYKAIDILFIIFRLKKVSSWKMSILDDLSNTLIKKPIEKVASLAEAVKKPIKKVATLADASGTITKRTIKSLEHSSKPPTITNQIRNVSIPVHKSVKLVIDKTTNRVFSMPQIESKCVPSNLPPLDPLSISSSLVSPHQSQKNQQQSTQFSLQSSYLFM